MQSRKTIQLGQAARVEDAMEQSVQMAVLVVAGGVCAFVYRVRARASVVSGWASSAEDFLGGVVAAFLDKPAELGRPFTLHPENGQAIYTPVMKSRVDAMGDGHWMNRAFAEPCENGNPAGQMKSVLRTRLTEEELRKF